MISLSLSIWLFCTNISSKFKKISFKHLIFALIGGLLMGLTVAPTNLWFLAWIGLIPLWVALYESPVTAILAGFLWGCGYHGFALFWITGIHPMTWMGVSWFNSLIIAIFCWLFITFWGAILVTIWAYILNIIIVKNFCQFSVSSLLVALLKGVNRGKVLLIKGDLGRSKTFKTGSKARFLRPTLSRLFLGVTIWCLLEKIWSFTPLWWTSLSFTQSPYNLAILQLLKISGPTTITLLIVLINGLFAENIISFLKNKQDFYKDKYNLIAGAIIILTITHGIGYLNYQAKINDHPLKVINVGIIQGNIPNEVKLYDSGLKTAMINYTKGYQKLAQKKADVVLTPETALPFFYNQIENNSPIYQSILEQKIPIFLGAFDQVDNNYTNSLFTIDKEGKIISKFDKIQLVPLGEYIPFKNILGNLIKRLSPLDTQLIAGKKEQIFNTPFGQAIVGICYDSAFAEIFRRQALQGGEFIITASNNAHYSDTMPSQHHAQDVMRSIETDRWTARSTNTGYSAIIDPHGNTKWISNLHEYQTHIGQIYRRDSINLYVAKGDWLIRLLLFLIIIYYLL
jgi:apolipoprotein N-acyltransferase